MEVKTNKENEKLTVEVSGRLDTLTAPEFESKVEPELSGVKDLVIDLKDLEYISSAGLRVLMGLVKIMKDQGEMKVINPSEVVMDVFSLTGFDSILNIE
ncbi:MAG: STAS domain-containing protein [Clostridiales bacterium]|nr:STAS domain-containing protein [Clostridiales bacterium]